MSTFHRQSLIHFNAMLTVKMLKNWKANHITHIGLSPNGCHHTNIVYSKPRHLSVHTCSVQKRTKTRQVPEHFTTKPHNVMSTNKQYSTLKLRPVFSWTRHDVFTFSLLELTQMVGSEVLNTAQQHKGVQGT